VRLLNDQLANPTIAGNSGIVAMTVTADKKRKTQGTEKRSTRKRV